MYQDWVANIVVVAGTVAAVFACVLSLHIAEIWIFGLAVWTMLLDPAHGTIGPGVSHMLDYIYFSAVTFTTVGFGDVVPRGPIRFLSGVEALTGFVLIAWSASFTYLEMERYWRSA